MKNSLQGKVAIVLGMQNEAVGNIVSSLLQQGCTVMAPAKSLQQLNWLKGLAEGTTAGRLLTQLTDMPDYEKAQDVAEAIIERYGRIDIAITAMIANKVTTGLSETNMDQWESMLDESITPCVVFNRILISMMKKEHQGVYINVNEKMGASHQCSSLSKIAASVQMQLSQQFAEEASNNGIRYYQLFVDSSSAAAVGANEMVVVTPETIGHAIVRLYSEDAVAV
jgi:NADP-dependent 3-hydroxy acid dehydrogenase YdfG